MRSADVMEQIETMGELPILPQTLLQIQKVATDDRSCAGDLADVILKDQALTMRVLKMVNSAFYQRRTKEDVRTVNKAVIVLGFETVRKVALGLSVFDMMSKLSRSPHLAEVHQHSIIVAAFAQRLAEMVGGTSPEEAFVMALVHDIGKAVLMECSPADYDAVLADIEEGMSTIDAERKHFGMGHDRAGRRLTSKWKLPNELQNLIGDHHDIDPNDPPRHLDAKLALICYADAMAHFRCTPEHQAEEFKILRKAGRALRIRSEALEELYLEISTLIGDLAENMDMSIGNLKDYASVVNVDGGIVVAPPLSPEEIARRTASQLDLYRAIGQGMGEGRNRDELLMQILEGAHQILGFERVVLLAVDHREQRFRYWLSSGLGGEELGRKMEFPLEHSVGALALAALQRRSFHVPMATSEVYGELAGAELLQISSTMGYVAAPVVGRDGVEAVIFADNGANGPDVNAETAAELNGLASQAGLVIMAQSAPKAPAPVAT